MLGSDEIEILERIDSGLYGSVFHALQRSLNVDRSVGNGSGR